MKDYLQIKEAAEYLNVTTKTMRNWDEAGKLKPYRNPMNKYRLYKKADLDKLLKKIRKI